jgi:hypothetical protein
MIEEWICGAFHSTFRIMSWRKAQFPTCLNQSGIKYPDLAAGKYPVPCLWKRSGLWLDEARRRPLWRRA